MTSQKGCEKSHRLCIRGQTSSPAFVAAAVYVVELPYHWKVSWILLMAQIRKMPLFGITFCLYLIQNDDLKFYLILF